MNTFKQYLTEAKADIDFAPWHLRTYDDIIQYIMRVETGSAEDRVFTSDQIFAWKSRHKYMSFN